MGKTKVADAVVKTWKLVRDICLWFFVTFCLLSGIVFMPSLGAILFLLIGVASMPLRMVRKVWEYIPKKMRFLKPLVLTVLIFVAMFNVPTVETTQEEPSSIVVEQDTETLEEEESTTVSQQSTLRDDDLLEVVVAEGEAMDAEEEQNETEITEIRDVETESSVDAGRRDEVPQEDEKTALSPEETAKKIEQIIAEGLPAYTGDMFTVINDNVPYFTPEEMTVLSYEYYSPLDELGRCGVCVASIGRDIMPTEERGDIGNVKPSGWNQAKYTGVVDGAYLYNRAHLIGHQLTGEDANVCNLITGTRYFNTEGMLPFENMVADYIKETGNHVMYRVTPVFEGDNLVATGVLMEAKSVEDDGEGVLFCVYCYNVQPGINIDYSDGSSALTDDGSINEH